MRELLGGKGANLAEMCRLGLPVPPGFTLPTNLCREFFEAGSVLSPDVLQGIEDGIAHIEASLAGPRFGDPGRPLLVSVRSGARESMPGMMDTVLNLGLNADTVEGLASRTGDRRFALDSYRRLLQMFGDVVNGLPREDLEEPLRRRKERRGVGFDHQLDERDLEIIIGELQAIYENGVGKPFPHDPRRQLREALAAVFLSWYGKRARTYRMLNGIPDSWGTAVNVQAMVFGNLGPSSATGVAFSRNPATGEREPMGEWLANAQGEDVVAGIRTPGPLRGSASSPDSPPSLEEALPEIYRELDELLVGLERHFRDIQDVEFTVEEGKLWVLQTRSGKRTASAALRAAVEMTEEGMIDRATAVRRVAPEQLDQLLHPQIDPHAPRDLIARGLPASPGAASGRIVFNSAEAERLGKAGESVVLVRSETSPEDIHGMHAARAILTRTGGMTSHAAVVARGMGRTCVVGCGNLVIDEDAGEVRVEGGEEVRVLKAGSVVTVDGASGEVLLGAVPTIEAEVGADFGTLLGWADEIRSLGVRANAETAVDAARAVELGAEGIGLCRTEHMFFDPHRILSVREMILADTAAQRRSALNKIEPVQRKDFADLLRTMAGRPMTVRLLDPPLHEFLPVELSEIEAIADDLGLKVAEVRRKTEGLREQNPMLGLRGCRLGLLYPEIYETQVRALYNAACDVIEEGGEVQPEVMVPLVMNAEELSHIRERIVATAGEVLRERGQSVPLHIGTMIELPRAALQAAEIAEHADFFSWGTNDLTQTAMGLSRDDAGRFLPEYVERGLLDADPFATIDEGGVGQLVTLGVQRGREARPGLVMGICGEHGGDPRSIHFFHRQGLDYVSCSPFRVPVARLAAAHAALETPAPTA